MQAVKTSNRWVIVLAAVATLTVLIGELRTRKDPEHPGQVNLTKTAVPVQHVPNYSRELLAVNVPATTALKQPATPSFKRNGTDGFTAVSSKYNATISNSGSLAYVPKSEEKSDAPVELKLSLSRISAGAADLYSGGSGTAELNQSSGQVRIPRGAGLSECYAPRGDGVEQTFVLEKAPAGNGDLKFTCELNMKGLIPLPARANRGGGICFLDTAGNFRVRYGQVMVHDSAAHGISIEPRLSDTGNAVQFSVPGEWLSKAKFPVVVDPLVGGDFQISPDNPVGVAQPAVAAGFNNYLVVWDDFTTGANTPTLVASVVSQSGIASAPFVLTVSGSGIPRPYVLQRKEVAFDGTNWLVVWSQDEASGGQVRGVFVSAGVPSSNMVAGSIVFGTDFEIALTAGTVEEEPLIAYNGSDYVVAWHDGVILPNSSTAVGSGIFFTRVSTSGLVAAEENVPSLTSPPNQGLLFLAPQTPFGDTLLIYRENGENPASTRATRIGTDGTVRDAGGISLFQESETANGFGRPIGAAFLNNEWEILSSYDQTLDSSVFLHHLSVSGVVTPPSGTFAVVGLGPTGNTIDQFAPAVAGTVVGVTTNGNSIGNWLFLRNEKVNSATYHIIGKRIGFDGTDQDPVPFQIDTSTQGILRNAVAAQSGNQFLVTWLDGRRAPTQPGDAFNIFGAMVDSTIADNFGTALLPSIVASPQSGLPPLNVSFDASGSSGSFDTLLWSFGDGTTSTFATVSHTYTQDGTYIAQLKLSKGAYEVFRTVVITVGNGGGTNNGSGSQIGTPVQNSDGLVTNLFIKAAGVALDFTQLNDDASQVNGIVDVTALPASLTGLSASVSIGSVTHSFTLDAKGQFKSDTSVNPQIAFSINSSKGTFVYQSAKDNLQAELATLGAGNVTTSPTTVNVPITVQLNTFTATSTVGLKYKAVVNQNGTGVYSFLKSGSTITGSFLISKFSAVQQTSGGAPVHTYNIQGQLVQPNGARFRPSKTGQFLFEIGNYSTTLPSSQFTLQNGSNVKFVAHKGATGLKKFSVDFKSGKFNLQMVMVPATGAGGSGMLLSTGSDIVDVDLNLSFGFDLSDHHLNAGRYIFIKRKKPTSKQWTLR